MKLNNDNRYSTFIHDFQKDYNERLAITKDIIRFVRHLDKTYIWFYDDGKLEYAFHTKDLTIKDINRLPIELLDECRIHSKTFQTIESYIDQVDQDYYKVVELITQYNLNFNDFFMDWEGFESQIKSWLNVITLTTNNKKTPQMLLIEIQEIRNGLKTVIDTIEQRSKDYDTLWCKAGEIKKTFRFQVGFEQYIIKHSYLKKLNNDNKAHIFCKDSFIALNTNEIDSITKCIDLCIEIDKYLNRFDKINAVSTIKYYQERLKDFMSYTSLYQLYLDVQKSNLD